MDYTTWTLPLQERLEGETLPITSLYRALQSLTDPRREQGKRYELALIVCLVVLAKLAGQTSLSGVTEWVRHRATIVAKHFGLRRKSMPCQMTYSNVLSRIDSHQLDAILASFFQRWQAQQRCEGEPSRLRTPQGQADHRHVAIDGKTLRATTSQAHTVHQLSCYEVATGIVLWHHNVSTKENEISALKPLLRPEQVQGRIFTLDAMHTQRWLCAQLHRWHGAYILLAKENQPGLREDIVDFFEDLQPDRRRWQQAETWDKGHGRLEHRQITCSPDLNDWFAKAWEGIEQVFRLERKIQIPKSNHFRHEVIYGISNLPITEAGPQRMLQLVRDHWAIENKLHYRRDVSFGEDGCQTRTGPVPGILAQLNSASLSLLDRMHVRNVARQMRYFDAHVDQALSLVCLGSCFIY